MTIISFTLIVWFHYSFHSFICGIKEWQNDKMLLIDNMTSWHNSSMPVHSRLHDLGHFMQTCKNSCLNPTLWHNCRLSVKSPSLSLWILCIFCILLVNPSVFLPRSNIVTRSLSLYQVSIYPPSKYYVFLLRSLNTSTSKEKEDDPISILIRICTHCFIFETEYVTSAK